MNNWIVKMAWRDSRRNRTRLVLFISSIVLGVAALVAINSFSDNLQKEVEAEAKELLGADLLISSQQPIDSALQNFMDSLGGEQSREIMFASMVLFPKDSGSRLVQVRALEGNFPWYGEIETEPVPAGRSFKRGKSALADNTLMIQFDAATGDPIKIGNVTFNLEGRILKIPNQPGIASAVAPPVYIPMEYLEQTGLLKKGSRVNYRTYFKFSQEREMESVVANVREKRDEYNIRYETVESEKEDVGEAYANLTAFLNLVAFVALLLGCIGVASAVHLYIKDKIFSVAVLRCLGVKGSQAFQIYLLQIGVMGFLGSLLGATVGTFIQFILPAVLKDFLPVDVSFSISFTAVFQGIFIGLGIAILFALLPLIAIRYISPLRTLRASFEEQKTDQDPLRYAVFAGIILFVGGFALMQLGSALDALFFTSGIIAAFITLTLVSKAMMWLVKRYFPVSWGFTWRQSLANLYRPNNQTLILVVAIGLGTTLISILFFIQSMLLNQVQLSASGNQPNMVLFDIQSSQEEEVAQLTQSYDLPLMQQVPIVTLRLAGVRGRAVNEILKDSTRNMPRRHLIREHRVTFRDSLISSETLVRGEWRGEVKNSSDTVYVSLSTWMADDILKAKIGDEITFNVQGALIPTVVGSVREVDFARVQTNFPIVFPAGVLEKAPKFHVIITKVPSDSVAASFQQAVVKKYPNVSIIDLKLILKTVDEVLGKVSFVIRFMALFSIITALLVLVGSVILSKYQRIQESVLLRTLGASRKQILIITALEYFFLGSLSALTGIIIALAGSYGLSIYSFSTTFTPELLPVLLTYLAITGLTILIGLSNSLDVLKKAPLEILRQEA